MNRKNKQTQNENDGSGSTTLRDKWPLLSSKIHQRRVPPSFLYFFLTSIGTLSFTYHCGCYPPRSGESCGWVGRRQSSPETEKETREGRSSSVCFVCLLCLFVASSFVASSFVALPAFFVCRPPTDGTKVSVAHTRETKDQHHKENKSGIQIFAEKFFAARLQHQ